VLLRESFISLAFVGQARFFARYPIGRGGDHAAIRIFVAWVENNPDALPGCLSAATIRVLGYQLRDQHRNENA
jgi:hypothetical protein